MRKSANYYDEYSKKPPQRTIRTQRFQRIEIKNMCAFYEAWQELDINSAVATAELQVVGNKLDINLETTVSKLQIPDNKGFINSPTAVGELETISAAVAAEMPEHFQRVLPNIEELRKVLSNQPTDK